MYYLLSILTYKGLKNVFVRSLSSAVFDNLSSFVLRVSGAIRRTRVKSTILANMAASASPRTAGPSASVATSTTRASSARKVRSLSVKRFFCSMFFVLEHVLWECCRF